MSKHGALDRLKEEMRDRLAADPRSLDLDPRTDEAPEDVYVRLAEAGRRADVVAAVSELIAECMARADRTHLSTAARLLSRAIRLCSAIGAEECAPVLKLVLLEHESGVWGSRLSGLQELAARALLGLPKRRADLRFWTDIAHRRETSLPYALRALIEIDLREGLRAFWQLYWPLDPEREDPLVDWRSIVDEADEHYDVARIGSCLEETFYEVSGETDPRIYESYMQEYLRLPKYSRLLVRTFDEPALGYGRTSRPSLKLATDPSAKHIAAEPRKPPYSLPRPIVPPLVPWRWLNDRDVQALYPQPGKTGRKAT